MRLMMVSRNISFAFIGMAVFILLIIFWSLNKGLGLLDEAFYLLHLKEGVKYYALSSWPEFFKDFPIKNIFWLRFFIFSLMAISAGLFGMAFSKYWKINLPTLVILPIIIVVQFVWSAPVQYIPNNSTLNQILIYLSLASFFWGINDLEKPKMNLRLVASGFFIGFVPFVMITNTPIIGAMMLLLIILIPNKKAVIPISLFTIGIILSGVVFFVFFQSLDKFLISFSEARNYLNFMDSHGLRNIIKWHYYAFIYFIGPPLTLLLLLLAFHFEVPKSKYSKLILIVIGIVVLGFVLIQDVFSSISIFSSSLIYVLAVAALIIFVDKQKDIQKTAVLLFLLLVPYFAALGTDVAFEIRTAGYALPLALVIMGVSFTKSKISTYAFYGLILAAFLTFLTYPFGTGWIGFKLSDQKYSLELPNGSGTLQLDQNVVETYRSFVPYLTGEENVVVSDPKALGYIYLCDATPLYLYFRLSDEYLFDFMQSGNRDWGDLTFLEVKNKPFSLQMKNRIEELVSSGNHAVVSLDNHIIYLPKSH